MRHDCSKRRPFYGTDRNLSSVSPQAGKDEISPRCAFSISISPREEYPRRARVEDRMNRESVWRRHTTDGHCELSVYRLPVDRVTEVKVLLEYPSAGFISKLEYRIVCARAKGLLCEGALFVITLIPYIPLSASLQPFPPSTRGFSPMPFTHDSNDKAST